MGGGGGGWEEKWRLRLNSVKLKLKLPAGAELGNSMYISVHNKCKYYHNNKIIGPYWLSTVRSEVK